VKVSRFLRAATPFAAAVVTVTLIAVAAGAHHSDLRDRDDTRGKLDVKYVRFAHVGRPPFWTVVTYGEWGTTEMWDRAYITVLLDTQGGAGAEYYLLIRSVRLALEGTLWRARANRPDTYLGSVPVKRLSRRSASVQMGLSRVTFGTSRSYYRWWVETVFTGDVCRRTCHDRAPSRKPVLQWRPGMSPTPSPSPSPSPSGSPSP
jgi:hypothetical protein